MYESAVIIARIMGPFLVAQALWYIFFKDLVKKMSLDAKQSPGLMVMFGNWHLLTGLIILTFYHAWHWDLTLFVTLVGWVRVIRGLTILFIPEKFMNAMKPGGFIMKIWGVFPLIVSLILVWLGYVQR